LIHQLSTLSSLMRFSDLNMNDTLARPVFDDVGITEIFVLDLTCCLFQEIDIESILAGGEAGVVP
jgi:hypothetical protein